MASDSTDDSLERIMIGFLVTAVVFALAAVGVALALL